MYKYCTLTDSNPKLRPPYYLNFIVNGFHKKHREYNTQKRAWFIERIFFNMHIYQTYIAFMKKEQNTLTIMIYVCQTSSDIVTKLVSAVAYLLTSRTKIRIPAGCCAIFSKKSNRTSYNVYIFLNKIKQLTDII